MSSERAGHLANLGYRDTYVAHLRSRLPEGWTPFSDFFGNLNRLRTLSGLLDRHLKGRGLTVLNIGCGPFATEIFVRALQGQQIVSFDYTAEFAPFYPVFRADGHLTKTAFLRADALSVGFRPESFDAIVIHDVLYETGLDLDDQLERFAPTLKPGGLVYLDAMNESTRRLWRMLGKEKAYRRYRREDVMASLRRHGFEVAEWRPVFGASGRLLRLFHAVLWHGARLCNTFAVVAVKVRPVKTSP